MYRWFLLVCFAFGTFYAHAYEAKTPVFLPSSSRVAPISHLFKKETSYARADELEDE